VLEKEREKLDLEVQVRELGVRLALMEERARQELRKEILPLEQAPEIAKSASGLLRGARLSLYGQDSSLVASLTPVLNLLADTLRSARPDGKAS
jgi:hypothetical protein